MSGIPGGWSLPGIAAIRETAERVILYSSPGNEHAPSLFFPARIDSTTVDSANTPTTTLRPGLVLADLGDGTFTDYDPASAVDAQRVAAGILTFEVNMLSPDCTAVDRSLPILVSGAVLAANILGLDATARSQMKSAFLFDDDFQGVSIPWKNEVAKTAAYTIVAADNNKLFTNDGAGASVTFTLPTLAAGLRFMFFGIADFEWIITSAAGNDIIALNDIAASTLTVTTAGEHIGVWIEVVANAAGDKWMARMFNAEAVTIGIA